MTQLERVMHLRSFGGLTQLDPAKLAVVAEHSVEHFFPAGSTVYVPGEPVEELHYVIEGEVAVRRNGEVIDRLGPRSVVGGLAVLASHPDGQDVVAVEDTVTLGVNREDQTEVFEDNFDMALAVLRAVASDYIRLRKSAGAAAGFTTVATDPGQPPPREMTVVDKLAYLRTKSGFSNMAIEVLADIAHDAVERRWSAGHKLWSEGDSSETSVLLVSGIVAGERRGQEFDFGPNAMVGSIGGLARLPRWYSARCQTDVVALELSVPTFLDVLEDNIDIALALLGFLANDILAMREANPNADIVR